MKLLIITVLFLFCVFDVKAQTTPTVSPTPEENGLLDKLRQIEILKDKIASKVSEVRSIDKGALYGQIKSMDNSTITLNTLSGEKKISYSEDTVFFNLTGKTKKEASAKDLKENLTISSFGIYDEKKTTLLSKYIFIETNPSRISGKIADIDKSGFTITVGTKEGNVIIDYERNTKSSVYEKGKGSIRGGFSRFTIGDFVSVSGIQNEKEENRYAATRILQIPQAVSPSPSPTPTPNK